MTRKLWLIRLIILLIFGSIALLVYYHYFSKKPIPNELLKNRYRSVPSWFNATLTPNDLPIVDPNPPHLSHLIITGSVEEFKGQNPFKSWIENPPFLKESIFGEKSWIKLHILVYNAERKGAVSVEQTDTVCNSILGKFGILKDEIKRNFKEIKCRSPMDSNRMGAFLTILDTKEASYVLVLTVDAIPIRPNWCSHFDHIARIGFDPAWIWGGIHRGLDDPENFQMGHLISTSASGLYNVGDGTFGTFYRTRVLPWAVMNSVIKKDANDDDSPWDRVRWNGDIFLYLCNYNVSSDWYGVAHRFRHTNSILDVKGTHISTDQLKLLNPDAFLLIK